MDATPRPYSATFRIPGLPPTLNALHGMCWQKRLRVNRCWRNEILLAIRNQKPPEPLKRARIIFTRHSSRPIDMDNWAGSCAKTMLDGLKGIVIVDDSMDIIETEYKWQRASVKRGYVEITIQEMEA